jgi:hypothetical protein
MLEYGFISPPVTIEGNERLLNSYYENLTLENVKVVTKTNFPKKISTEAASQSCAQGVPREEFTETFTTPRKSKINTKWMPTMFLNTVSVYK